MTTYSVWMQMPDAMGKRPWSNIARGLTEEEADVYRRTILFPVSVQPERVDRG